MSASFEVRSSKFDVYSDPLDVVDVDGLLLVGSACMRIETFAYDVQHAGVDDLGAVRLADDEERGAIDAVTIAQHHARARRIVLLRPDYLVHAMPQTARTEVLGRLVALAAI